MNVEQLVAEALLWQDPGVFVADLGIVGDSICVQKYVCTSDGSGDQRRRLFALARHAGGTAPSPHWNLALPFLHEMCLVQSSHRIVVAN